MLHRLSRAFNATFFVWVSGISIFISFLFLRTTVCSTVKYILETYTASERFQQIDILETCMAHRKQSLLITKLATHGMVPSNVTGPLVLSVVQNVFYNQCKERYRTLLNGCSINLRFSPFVDEEVFVIPEENIMCARWR